MNGKLIKKLKNQNGFTMLENILAATLLGFALFGGMTVMQNATASSVNGDMTTIATELANEKVEQVIADKIYNNYEYLDAENYTDEEDVGLYEMDRSVSITEVNVDDLVTEEEGSGIKVVTVSVTWGLEAYQTINVSTIVTNYDS
ncbi:hypothetical protein BVY03_03035 [bacterium K02(2017)]|nr:hypothetical protein BVY03_03035 [bacterium K02(2017)]